MHHIEMTDEQLEVLREVLRHELEAINIEVFRTDTHDFKEMLKHRREVLERVLEKISVQPVVL